MYNGEHVVGVVAVMTGGSRHNRPWSFPFRPVTYRSASFSFHFGLGGCNVQMLLLIFPRDSDPVLSESRGSNASLVRKEHGKKCGVGRFGLR